MSEKVTSLQDFIQPARLTDDQTGEVYVLDFSKESVVFCGRTTFQLKDANEFPVTG